MPAPKRHSSFFEHERKIRVRIKELREEQGLSVDRLAARIATNGAKVTGSQISKVENGRQKLTMEWIYRIADGLGIHWLEITEPLPPREKALLGLYRGLEEAAQDALYKVTDEMAKSTSAKRSG